MDLFFAMLDHKKKSFYKIANRKTILEWDPHAFRRQNRWKKSTEVSKPSKNCADQSHSIFNFFPIKGSLNFICISFSHLFAKSVKRIQGCMTIFICLYGRVIGITEPPPREGARSALLHTVRARKDRPLE